MDKPVCRLCGAKHWPKEPHVFKDTVVANTGVNRRDSGVNKAPVVLTDGVNKGKAGVNRNADRHSPGYMREYMRRYRQRTTCSGK